MPHVPPRSFHHSVATLRDVQIPKIWITQTPQPPYHQQEIFVTWAPGKISIRENFSLAMIPFTQIFPKTISPEIFPGIFTKNLSGTRDDKPVRDFPKMPHRIFREDSCIQSQPHAADPASKPVSASPLLPIHPASALTGFIAGRCAGI